MGSSFRGPQRKLVWPWLLIPDKVGPLQIWDDGLGRKQDPEYHRCHPGCLTESRLLGTPQLPHVGQRPESSFFCNLRVTKEGKQGVISSLLPLAWPEDSPSPPTSSEPFPRGLFYSQAASNTGLVWFPCPSPFAKDHSKGETFLPSRVFLRRVPESSKFLALHRDLEWRGLVSCKERLFWFYELYHLLAVYLGQVI